MVSPLIESLLPFSVVRVGNVQTFRPTCQRVSDGMQRKRLMSSTQTPSARRKARQQNRTQRPSGFDQFGLKEPLMLGLRAAGFTEPRPIQRETIAAGLDARDVLGLAQTGTGKTAAFALPLLDRLLDTRQRGVRSLIVAPTRELASQIAEEVRMLAKHTRLKVATVFGGVPIRMDIKMLHRRPEVIVGCPGRILDLVQRGALHLKQVESLVLDEADHMFDLGFLPDIRKILTHLPATYQSLFFSATMPKQVRGLANEMLTTPHVAELANSKPAAMVDHAIYPVSVANKRRLLDHMLADQDCDSALIFVRTKQRARRLSDQLKKAGHNAVGLHGNLTQSQRDRAMKGFRTGRHDILVATDIAARGIDVNGISHVINFDVPGTPEAYTHRIGRTGRSETKGLASTFVTRSDGAWVVATEKEIGSPIPRRSINGIPTDDLEMPSKGGGRNRARNGRSRNSRGQQSRNSRPSRPGRNSRKPGAKKTSTRKPARPNNRRSAAAR